MFCFYHLDEFFLGLGEPRVEGLLLSHGGHRVALVVVGWVKPEVVALENEPHSSL